MAMDSLDNDPVEGLAESHAPRASPPQPLFLADSDDDDLPRPPPQRVPEVDVDIDAMFADVENDDDPFNFQPLTSKLDSEALGREAEARHKKNMLSLTPHAIMSSSPPRDMGDDEGSKSKAAGNDKGKDGKKERRKPMRLDEGRLLGPTGFPKLIKDTKNFRIKGKGHEVSDLNRLLQVLGYWTHGMYPKTTFRDTVERVEKLCHSRRMNVALSVWKDEANGLINGRKPEDDEVIDLTDNPQENANITNNGSSRASSPVSDGAAYASSSSHPPSRPPSSGTELDDTDDFDIDAVIRDEEERVARERPASEASAAPQKPGDEGKAKPIVDDDEDESMWDALDAMQNPPQPITTPSRMDDDDAMWDELDALEASVSTVPVPEKPPVHHLDEDENMWDVVREIENNDSMAVQNPRPTRIESTPEPILAAIPQDDDDDWESMYA
ncbi:hypothetical protein D9615_003997 [Tricholomella constricta]|uniref:Chromosome segregation in meiosis protein n=1 Tax=Tricholomella constricta TaxID=117010 RepID=A0A8H5HDM8_9AGAR|nr:hypothetical protein D9615_003997 [Tricholomella constricta]